MAEAYPSGQPTLEETAVATDMASTEASQAIPYTWTNEYMEWRTQDLTLDRDRDYPRFSTEYFRRRWHWEAGEKEGDAAFAITALVGALRANRSQRPSLVQVIKGSLKHNSQIKSLDSSNTSTN